jgi:putative MATE family efflux protein
MDLHLFLFKKQEVIFKMEQTNQSFLATENVGTLMRKYAIPCIISLLVAALYNIVDQIFIANADYLGSYGNAANTVVFPLTVIALAIAVMIGDGCCAFVSLSLGKKRPEDANRSVGNAIVLTVVCGVILCAVYLLFQEPIITMFGGTVNEETFHHSKEYFFYISLGIPFYMFGQAMNPVIRADGSPKFAMVSTLAGAVINIILDPIFIFVCRWGMMGAAVATVIGQIVTAVLAIWYLAHTRTVHLSPAEFKLKSTIVGHSLTLGICSFLSQISLVAAMAAINNMIRHYGALDSVFGQEQYAQIPMAVVGIVMKFFQIVISIVVGMAAGCIPIVGFNMGAGLKQRVKNLFTRLLLTEAAVGFVAFLIVELLPRQLIAIFGAANESVYYTDFAIKAFRIYLCMIIFACVNKATFIFLQAMGKAVASTALSMIREIVFGVGFALLLPRFFGLDGVLYSMPVSDVLTAIVSAIIIVITYKQLDTETD